MKPQPTKGIDYDYDDDDEDEENDEPFCSGVLLDVMIGLAGFENIKKPRTPNPIKIAARLTHNPVITGSNEN